MPTKYIYLIISIAIIAFIIAIFFITYVINRRTPVPKGCEHIKITEENCSACQVTSCAIKERMDIEKIKEEIENEEEEK